MRLQLILNLSVCGLAGDAAVTASPAVVLDGDRPRPPDPLLHPRAPVRSHHFL